MPESREVQCINKQDRYSAWERITHIGGVNGGSRWRMTQEEAITAIEQKRIEFFVSQGFNRVRVIVAVSQYGKKYLKTEGDGEQPNNLLSLPECPRW